MTDTTADAARIQIELYRKMGPERRCALAAQMSADARAITVAGIRHRHPDYDDDRARLALFRILLGDDLFRRVYPDAALIAP